MEEEWRLNLILERKVVAWFVCFLFRFFQHMCSRWWPLGLNRCLNVRKSLTQRPLAQTWTEAKAPNPWASRYPGGAISRLPEAHHCGVEPCGIARDKLQPTSGDSCTWKRHSKKKRLWCSTTCQWIIDGKWQVHMQIKISWHGGHRESLFGQKPWRYCETFCLHLRTFWWMQGVFVEWKCLWGTSTELRNGDCAVVLACEDGPCDFISFKNPRAAKFFLSKILREHQQPMNTQTASSPWLSNPVCFHVCWRSPANYLKTIFLYGDFCHKFCSGLRCMMGLKVVTGGLLFWNFLGGW